MSFIVLAQGTLVADPQQRTSAKGTAYATAQLRVASDDGPILVSVVAFAGDAVAALTALGKGDSAAVTGRAKLTTWAGKNGEMNHGLSMIAEGVLSAYQVGKRRERTAHVA
jgi:single-stranded DNA-binding protein